MTIGIGAEGGCRGLFAECVGADVEALIAVAAGGSGASILEEIKSDRVGRTCGFIKTREKASAITFLCPSMYWIVHMKLLIVFCHLTCLPNNSVCLGNATKGLWSVRIVNLHPDTTGRKCSNASIIAKSSLSKVE